MNEDQAGSATQAQPGRERKGRRRWPLWIGVIAAAMVLLLCLLAGLTWAAGDRAKVALRVDFPPPAQMVDVGGYQLHVNCQGASQTGVPTVVLEAGAGEYSLTWDHVQRQVAEFARVCSYDRAGLGWSERGPNPRVAPYVAGELDTLLRAAAAQPPYVLVGHSMGGLYARYYTHEYPDQVVGMILVDSAHETENQRLPEDLVRASAQAQQILRIPQMLSASGLLAQDPSGIPGDFAPPQAPGTEDACNAIMAMSPQYWSTLIEEYAAVEETYAAIRNLPDRSLGDLPLIVISAGGLAASADLLTLSAEERASVLGVLAESQAELASLSSNSRHVIAEDATHYVHLGRPELMIDAIQEVVEAAQE